jgi:putative membrane protein
LGAGDLERKANCYFRELTLNTKLNKHFLTSGTFTMKTKTLKIIIVYLLLVAGGLWHLLGVLQKVMTAGAPVAMGLLSIWLIYEYVKKQNESKESISGTLLLGFWMLMVFAVSIAIEYIGVKTGLIFGTYNYGTNLEPTIGTVPVVIGFAWLNMILSSIAVAHIILTKMPGGSLLVKALLISLLMVFFDIIMEPAAVKLGYWSWQGGDIPFQNYIAWFLISYIFVIVGYGMNILKRNIPVISQHAYYAQLMYFILVNMKSG